MGCARRYTSSGFRGGNANEDLTHTMTCGSKTMSMSVFCSSQTSLISIQNQFNSTPERKKSSLAGQGTEAKTRNQERKPLVQKDIH